MTQQPVPTLSSEGNRFALRCHVYDRFTSLIINTYSQQLRPDGLVNFGVAENSLMHEELKEYWPKHFKLEDVDFGYSDQMLGSDRLNGTLASFFNKHFQPTTPVLPEHIAVGNGLTAVIEQLSTILCNPGEGFMTSRPYYNGFDEDMTVRSGAHVVAVDVGPAHSLPSTLDAFEHQFGLSVQAGIKPAAVMLTNPNNPLGFNYPRETIVAYARFCEKHNLHLVVDEIYALSQFENDEVEKEDRVPFTSILAIDVLKEAGCNPARVHMLYGVAKDFGANGLRIGVCVSQHNPEVHKAFITIGFMMKVSSVSDSLWSTLLNDDEMLTKFIRTNQELLGQTFQRCRTFFRKHQIPWLGQPTAALFFWLDLRRFHRNADDEGKALETGDEKDEDLRKRLAAGGLFISPGSAYHGTEPGWFRFTFSIRPDILKLGLQRFETFIQATEIEPTLNDP